MILPDERRHDAWLRFVRRVLDVPLGHDIRDLHEFRHLAEREYRALIPLIDQYIHLAERSETNARYLSTERKHPGKARAGEGQMHLFDLLRQKRLFDSNADLADFAGRILPDMTRYRFDKMSRGDIAARIVEYLETRDPATRERLEKSMRDALKSSNSKPVDRRDFFSKWEKIIKGIDL